MNHSKITSILSLTSVFALAASVAVIAQPAVAGPGNAYGGTCEAGTPDGYSKVLMFMANGETSLTGGQSIDPIGEFQMAVMGRDAAGVAQDEQDARDFLFNRFGVVEGQGTIFMPFALSEGVGYTNYMSSGERIHEAGWAVRDGGWMMQVTDPAGITLGGEFAGVHAPAGTAVVWGDYNILKTNRNGEVLGEEVIHYQSQEPIDILPDFSLKFNCELFHATWGAGIAQGIQDPVFDFVNGTVLWNTRNILTFSDSGGF